jgi:hypothetical protein
MPGVESMFATGAALGWQVYFLWVLGSIGDGAGIKR